MRGLIKQTLLKLLAVAGLAAAVSSGQAQDIQVVSYTNTAWIYNDTSVATTNPTIAPGVSWRDPAYVPVIGTGINTWKTNGHGLFGNDTSTVYTNFFGTAGNGFRTPLDRTGGRITFYFITKFSWPFTTNGVVLRGTNLLDDGAVVYLNGVEVFRKRIGTVGVIPAWGATADNQANEGVPEPLEYAATSLVSGQNTLAVEVHQTSAGSSDVAFATALRAIIPKAPTNSTPNEPSDRTVLQNRPTTLAIAGDGQPNPAYQWYKDGTPIPGANTNSYAIALMQSTDAGLYYVVLTNELGGYTSRVATVSYLADEVPPMVLRAIGSSTFTNVVIEFDELMDQSNTEDGFGYGIDGGLTILSASRNPDGRTATLHTTPQAENTLYTVSVNSPADLAGNVVVGTNVEFRSWVTTACGGVLFESFRNTGSGTAVSDLTSNPNYPNNPTEVYNLSRFDTRQVYPDDTHDNYGGRLRGVFIPPVSGNWVFYLRADDGVAFYLNPNGPSAAGKQLVQSLGGCCASFGANQTVPFPMIAGQAYFMETLYKEGGGGDYCAVAARLQGSTVPPDTESIPGTALGYGAIPAGALGTVSVTQSPADQTVQENTASVTFSVAANSAAGAPICYQWQRSDASGPFTDIPGANRASVSVTLPTIANDNGDRYRCVVAIAGSSATSAAALLTVTADTIRPRVTCVLATSTTSLIIYFSEALDPLSTDPFNFAVDQGVAIVAVLQNVGNPNRLDVTVSPMTLGTTYHVTVHGPATSPGGTGVRDLSGNPLTPSPTVANVNAQNFSGNPDTLTTLSSQNCLPLGCVTNRGFNARTYQLVTAIANDNATAELILTGAAGPNIAPAGAVSFMETGVINYNRDATNGAFTSLGHILPDAQFPGYPDAGLVPAQSYENMVMEVLCYVELKAGIHRWIVNSDDGFRVYAGHTASAPIIGEFNGGRGSSDTVFEFIVKQDCLYPFRLMWEQGQGGANVEWEKEDLNNPGTYVAINGDDSIKAYKVSPLRTAIRLSAPGMVEITWTHCNAQLQCANEVTGPWIDIAGATSPYVVATSVPRRFYRVVVP